MLLHVAGALVCMKYVNANACQNCLSQIRCFVFNRSQGMGLMLVSSRCGGATAPWIAQWLKHFHVAAPFSVMGGLTMIASLICFQLKETNKTATREVLEEVTSTRRCKSNF